MFPSRCDRGLVATLLQPNVLRSKALEFASNEGACGAIGRVRVCERAQTTRAGFLARVPKGRLGAPDDLAGPLLFLASKASDFYMGHILYADAGYTAG